ncbi:hypothetical protein D9M70_636380 [compost metagenome]
MTLAMRRAVTEDVGRMAPTAFALLIHPLKKRISSSNFRPSRSFTFTRKFIEPLKTVVLSYGSSGLADSSGSRTLRI